MNRPATIDGSPLMASTKIRTGRRNRLRVSLRNTAVARASGTVITSARPTCSQAADDGVRAAALGGGHGGGDAALVLGEEVGPQCGQALDDHVADQPQQRRQQDHGPRRDRHGRQPVAGHEPVHPVGGHEGEQRQEREVGDDQEAEPPHPVGQAGEHQPGQRQRAERAARHRGVVDRRELARAHRARGGAGAAAGRAAAGARRRGLGAVTTPASAIRSRPRPRNGCAR